MTIQSRTSEQERLTAARERGVPWRTWGPYLSERQWGTVREDYSDTGNAWDYFTHDQARSRAYRWGEDGLAGISDDHQRLCFALALWNGQDPDPQGAAVRPDQQRGQPRRGCQGVLLLPRQDADPFVHEVPLQVSAGGLSRTTTWSRPTAPRPAGLEYELLDTGVFEQDRYFDVFVEYAKASPEDILIQITVAQPRSGAGELHVLPTLWFRNTWSWGGDAAPADAAPGRTAARRASSHHSHPALGERYFYLRRATAAAVHRERDQHAAALRRRPTARPYVKDGINDYIVHGQPGRREPREDGDEGRRRIIRLTVNAPARADDRCASAARRRAEAGSRPSRRTAAVRRRISTRR